MNKHLHIVCHDVPYPPDYGGVVDLFYKIVALHAEGILIHLHCFEYGRGKQKELEKYCVEVNYYKRKSMLQSFSFRVPYIVRSRKNKILLNNLLKDDYPVLFEGIHCTYYLFHPSIINRKLLVRLHNVEYRYYKNLAVSETSFFKKLYFLFESRLLWKYEKEVASMAICIAITEVDKKIYKEEFKAKAIKHLPVFVKNEKVESKIGHGNYCIYHGNLSVRENEKIVLWLIKNVFSSISIPFIIVGKKPSINLIKAIKNNRNICIEANPSEDNMTDLIRNAQINVLPAQSSAGIKIKLLNAIFNGRHCLVNSMSVSGTSVEAACNMAESSSEFIEAIETLYKLAFTEKDIQIREKILKEIYNNTESASQLIHLLY